MSDVKNINGKTYKIYNEIKPHVKNIKLYNACREDISNCTEITLVEFDLSKITEGEYERRKNGYKLLNQNKHQNISKIYNKIEKTPIYLYLIMEHYDTNLMSLLYDKSFKINDTLVFHIFEQLLDVIGFLHSKNIVYLDINPYNILISNVETMDIVLANYGSSMNENSNLTNFLDFTGIKLYMPPEILNKESYEGKKVDIWSIGIIFYLLLVDKLPFKNIKEIKEKEIEEPPSKLLSDLCTDILKLMLNKNPSNRPYVEDIKKNRCYINLHNNMQNYMQKRNINLEDEIETSDEILNSENSNLNTNESLSENDNNLNKNDSLTIEDNNLNTNENLSENEDSNLNTNENSNEDSNLNTNESLSENENEDSNLNTNESLSENENEDSNLNTNESLSENENEDSNLNTNESLSESENENEDSNLNTNESLSEDNNLNTNESLSENENFNENSNLNTNENSNLNTNESLSENENSNLNTNESLSENENSNLNTNESLSENSNEYSNLNANESLSENSNEDINESLSENKDTNLNKNENFNNLEEMKLKELKFFAKANGFKNYCKKTKKNLLDYIKKTLNCSIEEDFKNE